MAESLTQKTVYRLDLQSPLTVRAFEIDGDMLTFFGDEGIMQTELPQSGELNFMAATIREQTVKITELQVHLRRAQDQARGEEKASHFLNALIDGLREEGFIEDPDDY